MLTTFDADEYVYEALRAGASGFMLKDVRPEQLADRLPERLPLDVPERDVDPADRVDRRAAPSVEDRPAVHRLPEPLDVEGIAPEQQLPQPERDLVRAAGLDDRLAHLRRGIDLTDPDEALVGVHPDDEVVLAAVCDALVDLGLTDDDGFDVGDPHACQQ